MSNERILTGNWARAFVAFRTTGGAVISLADVTANIVEPASAVADVTADIVSNGVNRFYVDILVPDNGEPGQWGVDWDSNPPSPQVRARRSVFHVDARACV